MLISRILRSRSAALAACVSAVMIASVMSPSSAWGVSSGVSSAVRSSQGGFVVRDVVPLPGALVPRQMAVDPVARRLYVAHPGDGGISVFSTTTRRLTAQIPSDPADGVGAELSGLAVDAAEHHLFVGSYSDDTVSVVDTETSSVVATIPLGAPEDTFGPVDIALDGPLRRAFVLNTQSSDISVIDTASLRVIGGIDGSAGIGRQPEAIAVDAARHKGYVTNTHDGTVAVFSTVTGLPLATITRGGSAIGGFPSDIALDSAAGKGYVVVDGAIAVIDLTTDTVSRVLRSPEGIGPAPAQVEVDETAGRAYVTDHDTHTLSVIDTTTDAVIDDLPRVLGTDALAVDAATSRLYAGDATWSAVAVIEPVVGRPSELVRIAGADRYATSAEVSSKTFDPGVPVAYVATGATFPDALAGSAAAAARGGPLLLVAPDGVPVPVDAELTRLRPSKIVVLGGRASVSDSTVAALEAKAPLVQRLDGADRYAVSAKISADVFGPGVPTAFVASGDVFPDALAGSAAAARLGGPVLLVQAGRVPDDVSTELERLQPRQIVVLGGAATVSTGVLSKLDMIAPTRRIAGANRYETAAAVTADLFGADSGTDTVYVASGQVFPDALAGGAAAVTEFAPVMLVERDAVPDAIGVELARIRPRRIVVLGGVNSVGDATAQQLRSWLR